ncbi:MAG: beta-1,3-glucanase family protein [Gemmataceae bacterium]
MSPISPRRLRSAGRSSRSTPAAGSRLRLEPLESRDVPANPAVPAAAVLKPTAAGQTISTVTTLDLVDNTTTADFPATGSLFVQTSNGVATVTYTGKTATSFTGLTVDTSDPFKTGARDATGAILDNHSSAFQATTATYQFDFSNAIGLGPGTIPTNDVYVGMYWSSIGSGDPLIPSFYYWDAAAGGATGAYAPVSKLGQGANLPTYKLAFDPTSHTATVHLPYMPTNSARFVFGVGAAPQLPVVADASGHLGVAALTYAAPIYWDMIEFTLDSLGDDPTFQGRRPLPKLNINTSQIDQFGLPVTLTGNANIDGKNVVTSVGVQTNTPAITRAAIISGFADFLAGYTDGPAYRELVTPATGDGPPLRLSNPKAYLPDHPASTLHTAFDAAITTLFESPSTSHKLTSLGGTVYTGTPATVTAPGSDGQDHAYRVLQFKDPAGNAFNLFEPFFSTNGHAGRPPAPKWFNDVQGKETAGQMVFSNDGVFTDAGRQPAGVIPAVPNAVAVMADLGNQVVVALNRGVAIKYSTTADWTNPDHYYPAGEPANLFAAFLHTYQIGGKDIFIDRKAYVLAYDDQGGQNPSLDLLAQTQITTTLGRWISTAPGVPTVAAGADTGGGPHVVLIDARTGEPGLGFYAFDKGFTGGVRVSAADFTGDGVRDLAVGAGPGGGPHVRVFDGATGKVVLDLFAFEPTFTGGVYVAAADLDGDGKAELVVAAGSGGGPRVRTFDAAGKAGLDFFAYDPSFRGGVTVAAGDVDGDGKTEIVTGAGPGGAPHVNVFDGKTGAVKYGFFAFDQAFRGGVYVAVGDVDGNETAEVVVSPGPGGDGKVLVYDAASGTVKATVQVSAAKPAGGLRVGTGDVDGDGRDEVLVAAGAGAPPRVSVYDVRKADPLYSFLAFDPGFTGGVSVDG